MGIQLYDLPARLQRRLAKELKPGEHVVWLTRPLTSRMRPGKRPGWKMAGTMFMLAALLVLAGLWRGGGRWVVVGTAGCGVCALLGVLYSIGPGRPIYAVTNCRAILLNLGWGGGFYYWFPEDLAYSRTRSNDDGSGDIVFGQEYDHETRQTRHGYQQEYDRQRFDGAWYGLPNVAEAEEHLSALQAHGAAMGLRAPR